MKKLDHEILLTIMKVIEALSSVRFTAQSVIESEVFQFPKIQDNIKTPSAFNEYVENVLIPGFYNSVMHRFEKIADRFFEEFIWSLSKEQIAYTKKVINQKIDEIEKELEEANSDYFKYFNCDIGWLEDTQARLSCSYYLRSSLTSCVSTIFKDIFDKIKGKEKVELEETQEDQMPGFNNIPPVSVYSQYTPGLPIIPSSNPEVFHQPASNSYLSVLPISIPAAAEHINSNDILYQNGEIENTVQAPEVLFEVPSNNTDTTGIPKIELQFPTPSDIKEMITKPVMMVNFEQPLIVPTYDNEMINKHFIIGKHILINPDDSEIFKTSLLTAAEWVEDYDKERKFRKPTMFGISNFTDVYNYELTKITKAKETVKFVDPEDKGYIFITIVNDTCKWFIKDDSNQLVVA